MYLDALYDFEYLFLIDKEKLIMINYYIHQIGNINDEKTYERLVKILKSRMICSRDFLEKNGFTFEDDHPAFKLDIPDDKKWMYYDDDIHKDRVSLSNPENRFIRKCIERKDKGNFTCFNYNYIAFAISKDVPLVPKEQTKGLALGEVQVFNKIDSEYIVGLVLPFSREQLFNEKINSTVETIYEVLENNHFPLDIYNYEGEVLKLKKAKKCK